MREGDKGIGEYIGPFEDAEQKLQGQVYAGGGRCGFGEETNLGGLVQGGKRDAVQEEERVAETAERLR